jgi:hypothetical protein
VKNTCLILLMATLLGGCASTDVSPGYIDRTVAMTDEEKSARLLPYSGVTEIQVTESPFEAFAAMVDRGYFLLGEAVYDRRGKLPHRQLAADGAEVGADVVIYHDYARGRSFRHDMAGKGGPTFQAFAKGETYPAPSVGSLTADGSNARTPRYYAQFWRKASG